MVIAGGARPAAPGSGGCAPAGPDARAWRGFSLVEVLVATTILILGVLGAAATAAVAGRRLREAHAAEQAVASAALVLDSLVALDEPGPGERSLAGQRLRWTTRRDRGTVLIELEVEYDAGSARRRLVFAALHAPSPAPSGAAP